MTRIGLLLLCFALVAAASAEDAASTEQNSAANESPPEEKASVGNEGADQEEDDDDDQTFTDASLEELERELEQPGHKRHNARPGWAAWSEWSTCSRTCDGGASYQLRRCTAPPGCRGEPVRYRICNMQPCSDNGDFREQQCAAYNDIPYEGHLYKWSASHDEYEPCALTCKTRSADGRSTLVVQLAPKVQDGTRCRHGSLDMCISGKCQRVGCDLKIGSTLHVDECGVCGGNGSSCAKPLYKWEDAGTTACSATCGGGVRMTKPVCKNRISKAEEEDALCNASQKPEPSQVVCNPRRCPPKYVVGEWGPCSVTCGGGTRYRPIFCAEEGNGSLTKVADHFCHGHKTRYQEQCNTADCPEWDSGEWSGCSVSCGEGIQTRRVLCRDARGDASAKCEPDRKPLNTQPCRTGIECPKDKSEAEEELSEDVHYLKEHSQHLIEHLPPLQPQRLIGEQIIPSQATFITEDWGPCNVSCGDGWRQREVNCKIFLEFSRTIAKLPDFKCHGPKPSTLERCYMPKCISSFSRKEELSVSDPTMIAVKEQPMPDEQSCIGPYCNFYHDAQPQTSSREGSIRVAPRPPGKSGKETYSWQEQGYTYCSASCLGGVQELIVSCVRESDGQSVSPYLCPIETRPVLLTRTCNDVPCPPRWNYSDFQECSKPCGIGIQLRDVTCIHEVARGGGNTVVVPNSMCPQPPPPDRQYCNVLDCPVKWHSGEWSKCSRACSGGMKTRKVECMQMMAQGHIQGRPPSMCPPNKPAESKACNAKPCDPGDSPTIASTNQTYIQQTPKKKVTLKIGGQAAVFWGTQVKIKCPVKKYNRTKIFWKKDQKSIRNSKKYSISKKGALRVQDVVYSDSGIYTCMAGRSFADITLTVKPRPGHFPTSEEIDKIGPPGSPVGGSSRQTANNLDPFGFSTGHDSSADAGYGSMNLGEARAPQPFNNLEDLSHELGGPPLQAKTTKPPWQKGRKNKNKENNEENDGSRFANKPSTPESRDVGVPTPPPPLEEQQPPSAASSSSRPMPHFQQLLANLQPFSNSRGLRMVDSPFGMLPKVDDSSSSEDEATPGPVVILGKGSKENLKFEWVTRQWSACSQPCGSGGIQAREVICMVRLQNNTQPVEGNLCFDAGLESPAAIQDCGSTECPKWAAGPWTECDHSRCFTWNTAMQRREVNCQFPNGTITESPLCDEKDKPSARQECYNVKCKGTWKVGEWSDCTAACDTHGTKYRILQCVWYGTKKPAGNACRDQPRPSVMKMCKGPPCRTLADCRDQITHCRRVKMMNLCRVYRYQYQCCQTCRGGMG
ncbi:protein madd-4 isoform X2 [Neocloeon triangulifer]|uniref:protein madd-4 isoform X2 n=1 Tax=Neocloeon triangulifer TaxID=2078957 RepID=UPI00286F95CD|nr:protein madd-4 isoform X2 [Neocloeon triangulifer]